MCVFNVENLNKKKKQSKNGKKILLLLLFSMPNVNIIIAIVSLCVFFVFLPRRD